MSAAILSDSFARLRPLRPSFISFAGIRRQSWRLWKRGRHVQVFPGMGWRPGARAATRGMLQRCRLALVWGVLALFLTHLACASVDINTADEKQLRTVKGIGPVKAKALLAWRSKNGAFRSVADVRHVKGFGAKILARIGHELTIGGRPLMPATPTGH